MARDREADVLRKVVAEKLKAYLADNSAEDLARQIGVSTPTVNRWKNERTTIAVEHFRKLAGVLDLQEEVAHAGRLPHARGLVRKSELLPFPRRVVACLIRLLPQALRPVMEDRYDVLTAFLHQSTREALRAGWTYRMGFAENWVQESRVSTTTQVFQLLEDANRNAGPGDLLFVCVSSDLFRDTASGDLVLGSPDDPNRRFRLDDLANRLKRFGHKTLLTLQALTPRNGAPTVVVEELYHDLRKYGRPGFAVITAQLPQAKTELEEWPLYDADFCRAIRQGKADRTQTGQITASDLWQHTVDRVNQWNEGRKGRGGRGEFKAPFLLYAPFDPGVIVAAPLNRTGELTGERALLTQLQGLGIRSSLSEICALTRPHPLTGTALEKLREAATRLGARVEEPGDRPEEEGEARQFLREHSPFIAYVAASKLYEGVGIPGAFAVAVCAVTGETVSYFGPETFEGDQPEQMGIDDFIAAWGDWGFTTLVVRSAKQGRGEGGHAYDGAPSTETGP